MTRNDILEAADRCVNGERDHTYGSPENNFATIADFWNTYLASRNEGGYELPIEAKDVACMLALLKIARISTGTGKADNWVDLAGYAACGGEIETCRITETADSDVKEVDPIEFAEMVHKRLDK